MKLVRFLLLVVVVAMTYVAIVMFVAEPVLVYAFSVPETFDLFPSYSDVRDLAGFALGWLYVGLLSIVLIAVTVFSLFRQRLTVESEEMDACETGQERLPPFFQYQLEACLATAKPVLVFDPMLVSVNWSELDGKYASSIVFERKLAMFRYKHSEHFPSDMLTNDLLPLLREQGWMEQVKDGTVVFFCRVDSGRMAS